MESKFLTNFKKKETMSENYQAKAREELAKNGNMPCEVQCRYLQMAADLEYEMSQISIGAEQARHEREKNRLDNEIFKIRQSLNASKSGKNDKFYANNGGTGKKSSEEEQLERTVRTWYKEIPKHSFDDVSGMAILKAKLQGCITDAKSEDLIDFLQIPKLNSYFFVGPPGCGKTYIIEAFAHELAEQNYKFISLQGSDIISRYVGDAEKIVSRLFEEAKNNSTNGIPCIIFIDEIDSVCKNRSLPNLPEYAANITTSFLTGFNQIHSDDSKVVFIGATNYPQRVDSAMLDRVEVIEVPLPDAEAREAALRRCFDGIIQLESGLSFASMATDTKNYNYRDIERISVALKKEVFKELIENSKDQFEAIRALRSGSYLLTFKKWNEMISKFKPSPKKEILDAINKWKKINVTEEYYDETVDETLFEVDEPNQIQE